MASRLGFVHDYVEAWFFACGLSVSAEVASLLQGGSGQFVRFVYLVAFSATRRFSVTQITSLVKSFT